MGKPIPNPLSKDELETLYVSKRLSALKIAAITGVKHQQLYYLLSKYGIPRRNPHDKLTTYTVNHNYFDQIDCEEKAYWLGFLYADGYLSGNTVGLTLSVKDLGHLEAFRAAIGSTHPIHRYEARGFSKTQCVRIQFASNKMASALSSLGCVHHKSLVLRFPTPTQVPAPLIRHFIRGYLDGDGCITNCRGKGLRIKICGTKEFLEALRGAFNEILPPTLLVTSPLGKRRVDDKNSYSLEVGAASKSKLILHYLYDGATVFLARKHERYLLYLQKLSSLSEMVGV